MAPRRPRHVWWVEREQESSGVPGSGTVQGSHEVAHSVLALRTRLRSFGSYDLSTRLRKGGLFSSLSRYSSVMHDQSGRVNRSLQGLDHGKGHSVLSLVRELVGGLSRLIIYIQGQKKKEGSFYGPQPSKEG